MTNEENNNIDHTEFGQASLHYDSTLSKSTSSPGFLVSFLVDARGGAMFGRRHSGIDIIIPPGKVCMPTRLTCRMVKKDKIPCPPPLGEEEAFVSRFIQVGPTQTSFIGPVLIEIPHFGSLQNLEREVVVMRSDDGKTWQRHNSPQPSEAFLQYVKEATKDYPTSDKKLVMKVYTTELPKYFVVVSIIKQICSILDSKGGLIQTSTASINVPQGAVNKETRVTLKVLPVEQEALTSTLRDHQHRNLFSHLGHSQPPESSHIVSIEPRRRKFHQPVTVNISVSKGMQEKLKGQRRSNKSPVLLLYTFSNPNTVALWQDATELAAYSMHKDTVSFSTNVSARYWLLEEQQGSDTVQFAKQAYQAVVAVPFYACFHVLAKPLSQQQWQIRVLCVDDTKVQQSMEMHDNFELLSSSQYVQVLNSMTYHISLSGNLKASVALPGQLTLTYRPFRLNRLAFVASVLDASAPLEFKVEVDRGCGLSTICTIDNKLPNIGKQKGDGLAGGEREEKEGEEGEKEEKEGEEGEKEEKGEEDDGENWKNKHDQAKLKAGYVDLNNSNSTKVVEVAELLKGDWVGLAEQLGVHEDQVLRLQTELGSTNEQALLMLQLWMGDRRESKFPALEAGLRKIGREDIVDQCLAPPTQAVNQDVSLQPIDSSYHESLHGDEGEDGKEEEGVHDGGKNGGVNGGKQDEDQKDRVDEEFSQACDDAGDYTEEEEEEEVVRVGEGGEEVREVVKTKVRTLKKSPLHDAPEGCGVDEDSQGTTHMQLKITQVPTTPTPDA